MKFLQTIPILLILLASCKKEIVVHESTTTTSLSLKKSPQIPELFGENFISTGLYERDMAIAPDGSEFVYTLGNYNQSKRCLVIVRKTKNGWMNKSILNFSGKYNDIEPFYAPDGNSLFFASDRPIDSLSSRKDYNIWIVKKTDTIWGKPQPLKETINTEGDEFYPSVTKEGHLYFTATRDDGIGREDIFVSRFENNDYQQPQVLSNKVNSQTFEFNAFISPDEDLLIFSSFGRPDGLGGGDLYYSIKDSIGAWSEAVNFGETINSDKLDFCPFVDYRNGNFYFSSNRQEFPDSKTETISGFIEETNSVMNGMGNIYRLSFEKLNLR